MQTRRVHFQPWPTEDYERGPMPACKVRRDQNFILTDDLDAVTCVACLRRIAFDRQDETLAKRVLELQIARMR